jgi:hypothetical protein
MSTPFEQLAQGLLGSQPQARQNWNQTVGAMPQQQFTQAAAQAFQQVDPREYANHTQPGVGGTDPFGSLPQPQQTGLAQTLLNALVNRGVNPQQVQQGAGIGTLDPNRMGPQELAALAQWMQQNHPQALGQAAAQYQNQPDLLSTLMGNKTLLAMGAALGATYLANRAQGRPGL